MVGGDSTKVGDICKLMTDERSLGKSPHETFNTRSTTTPKETAKIVFMMQSHAIAPTNQISVWAACEIELLMVYTYAGLSMAMNR
jgi:hypothetical protein